MGLGIRVVGYLCRYRAGEKGERERERERAAAAGYE